MRPEQETKTLRLPGSNLTWVDQVARHARQLPDRAALRFEGRTTTWADLRGRTSALASALDGLGVRSGDRVAVLMSNRPEFLESVVAASTLGAIAVPINFRLSRDEVRFMLADCGAVALLADAGCAELASDVREALTGPGVLLSTGTADPGLDRALAGAPREMHVDANMLDPALIMYTSGTTGRPKGAVLTHANLAAQTQTLIQFWQLHRGDEVNLCAVPMFHIGAIGTLAPMLAIGGTTAIMPSGQFDADVMLDILEAEKVTHVFMVPAQWHAVVAVRDAAYRAARLRILSWGAAPATQDLLEQMAKTFPGVPNVSTFGQTEMSPTTAALGGDDARRKLGSVGRPVPAVDIRVVDDEMNDVAPGQVGEIVYRGPGLMQGYWNRPDETARAFWGGWFHSGDLVRQDDEGYLYVVDRKKDMIISGGENIYCAEVENVLAAHAAVAEVAVVGAPNEKWGETPVAVVVTANQSALTLDDLVEWCRPRLAAYKRPTRLVVVEALPRNASGKVLKSALRERVTGVS
jgi:fatty-acyl-CoA synthase